MDQTVDHRRSVRFFLPVVVEVVPEGRLEALGLMGPPVVEEREVALVERQLVVEITVVVAEVPLRPVVVVVPERLDKMVTPVKMVAMVASERKTQ